MVAGEKMVLAGKWKMADGKELSKMKEMGSVNQEEEGGCGWEGKNWVD